MKISKDKLKQIVREELASITENKNTLNINSQNNSKEIFVSSKEKKASRKKILKLF